MHIFTYVIRFLFACLRSLYWFACVMLKLSAEKMWKWGDFQPHFHFHFHAPQSPPRLTKKGSYSNLITFWMNSRGVVSGRIEEIKIDSRWGLFSIHIYNFSRYYTVVTYINSRWSTFIQSESSVTHSLTGPTRS